MIENFNIPNSCKVGKKLFKKQFLENFSLNVNEKKILSEMVDSITLEYLLNKDNINILPFIDEEKDYSEIAFVKVEILNQEKLKQIAHIIQNIPYKLYYHSWFKIPRKCHIISISCVINAFLFNKTTYLFIGIYHQ